MSFKDFRIAWRQLAAEPAYTAVVVLGLALAFATVMLLMAYLDVALHGDSDVPEADRVMRLESISYTPGAERTWIPDSAMAFHEHWAEAGVPVAAATRYYTREMSVKVESRLFLQNVAFVDPGITSVFGLRAVAGDLDDTLKRPDSIAISVRTAQRLFGTTNVLGRNVQIAGRSLAVRALVRDRPPGSVISTAMLANINSPVMPEQFRLTFWFSIRGTNYLRLLPGIAPAAVGERAEAYIAQTPAYKELPPSYGKIAGFRAIALPELALSGAGSETTRRLAVALTISCLVITALAAINYVNLSTVRTISRQKEIGIRKALGASPGRVAMQFIEESILVAFLACLVGIAIARLVAPGLSEWVDRPIGAVILSPAKIAAALGVSVILGVLAGMYPAWVAGRTESARSLAGRARAESPSGLWLRRGLSVLQFAAAIALIGVTIVVLWQTWHSREANPGYDAASVLAIDMPVDMTDARVAAVRDALTHLPGVQAAGLAWDIPGRFRRNTTADVVSPKGQALLLGYNFVGPGFFQSYGVRPLAGRIFDPESDQQGNRDIVVINARAAQQLGFADPREAIGQKVRMGGRAVELIGVVPDIRQRSLREEGGGAAYGISSPRGVSVLSVHSADPARTRRLIETLWPRHFPDDILQMEVVRAQLARLYDGDARLGKLIGAGGLIGLALAAFGLYSFSAYTVRRRTPEIVLRTIHGARPRDIGWLVGRECIMQVALGALIGLPIAAWFAQRFLSAYVDRAPAALLSLAAALVCTSLVAFAAAARHTLRAMAVSPMQALRA